MALLDKMPMEPPFRVPGVPPHPGGRVGPLINRVPRQMPFRPLPQGSMRDMSHADLLALRELMPLDDQQYVAPFEHRAFAREWTQENPWLAVPSLLAAIPGYSLAKSLGKKARSPAGLLEMGEGYTGMWEGLLGR